MARPKRYPASVLNDKSRHFLSLASYVVEQLIGRCRLQPWWEYLTDAQKETAVGGTLAQRRRLLEALKPVEFKYLASDRSRSLSTDAASASLGRARDLRGHGSLSSSRGQGYAPSVEVHPIAHDDNRKLAAWVLAHQEEVLAMIPVASLKTPGVQVKGRVVPTAEKPGIPQIVLANLSGKHRANQRASAVIRMGLHWVERVVGPASWQQIHDSAGVVDMPSVRPLQGSSDYEWRPGMQMVGYDLVREDREDTPGHGSRQDTGPQFTRMGTPLY